MTITNKEDLRAMELAFNSAINFHLYQIELAQVAISNLSPERELQSIINRSRELVERYRKLSTACAEQQIQMEIHEKAAS